LAVDAPTPTAKTSANRRHIKIRGSFRASLNGLTTPFLKKRLAVSNKKINASMADKSAATDFTSQGKGRKKVAVILFTTSRTGLDAFTL
jgi:hypothetical protein